MNKQDLSSLSQKTREDGKRLFGVCEFLYKAAIVIIWIIAAIGFIASLSTFSSSITLSLGILLITAAFCFVNYMLAVLSTHVAKVLVHNSFASLGLLEYFINNSIQTNDYSNKSIFDNEFSKNKESKIDEQSSVVSTISKDDPEYFEAEKLLKKLASYGYEFVSFDENKGVWYLRAGSTDFECTFSSLNDLAKNFN